MRKLLPLLVCLCLQYAHANTFTLQSNGRQYINDRSLVAVKFENTVTREECIALADPTIFEPFDQEQNKPEFLYAYYTVKAGVSEEALAEAVQHIASQPHVLFASPLLQQESGMLCAPTNSFFVKLKSPTAINDLFTFLAEEGYTAQVRTWFHNSMILQVTIPMQYTLDMFDLLNDLYNRNVYAYCEPNFLLIAHTATDDTYYDYQWSLNNTGSAIQYNGTAGADVDAVCAWAITKGAGSKVAILDEGVDLSHPDLMDNLLPGYDACFWGGGTFTDTQGGPIAGTDDAHGTNCAGIVCAIGNNALGVTGVAPESNVVPVHIAYENGFGGWTLEYAWVADAIMWACDEAGADVLSNSYSLGDDPAFIDDAIDYCITDARGGLGGVFLGAAGNYNTGTLIYPGSYTNSIAVAATSMCDERKSPVSCDGENFWGSCYGTKLDIAAPGVKIPSTDISGSHGYSGDDYYLTFNGTSSATPLAAGIVALMYSIAPELTHEQARYYLESTCEKVGGYAYADAGGHPNGTWVNQLGYGRVNACDALNSIIENFFKADLITGINTVSEDTVYPGQNVELNYFIENAGATDAATFNHQFFVSTDCAPGGDEAADVFPIASLEAEASTLLTNTITIPESASAGIRQILLYADEDNTIDESMESNNYSCIEVQVVCSIGPESSSQDYDFNAVTDSLHIVTTSACNWNFSPAPPAWITVTTSAGTGDGYFRYALDMNTEFVPRSYTFNYADKTYTINQGALQNAIDDVTDIFLIYPNPAKDHITIQATSPGMEYMIYNSIGDMMLAGTNMEATTTIDVHTLAAGTYVITLQNEQGKYNSVFVKE